MQSSEEPDHLYILILISFLGNYESRFDMDRGMAEIHHSSEALKTMREYGK